MSGRVVKTVTFSLTEGIGVDLGPLGAPDPVALHHLDLLGPPLQAVEPGEQAVGIIGDAKNHCSSSLDTAAAALAGAVHHLLI